MVVQRFVAALALTMAAVSAIGADEQKCSSAARDCEIQIRQMLAGKTYLGVKLTQSRWGLVVQSVSPKSPAALGGLQEGDRLFAVNGKICSKADAAEFKRMVGQVRGNKALHLTIVRAGQVRKVYIRPEHLSKAQVDKVVATHLREAHQTAGGDTQAAGSH